MLPFVSYISLVDGHTSSLTDDQAIPNPTRNSYNMKFSGVFWMPPWCRWDDTKPPPFNIWLNILFACAGGFTAANLYYSHPILDVMADSFHTDQSGVTNIPSLALAGDVTGLLFILPLADFLPRRKFVLVLTSLSTLFW